jgi:4-carboxymuconolactone decarboxylase
MKLLTPMLGMIGLLTQAPFIEAESIAITRGGSRAVRPGPSENFTGGVRVEMLFEAVAPSHASGGSVTFEAGARTAWHLHPGGQILIVTAGTGRVQQWGGPLETIQAGDVVRIPPGQKHWHGASPQAAMTHLAITEPRDGTSAQWMEKVSEEQYNGAPAMPDRPGQPTAQPPVPSEQQPPGSRQQQTPARPSGALQQKLAPGLAMLTDEVLFGDVWRRAELSPRDRSLVTVSVLIATGKPAQLVGHLGRALDNGVKPSEASGLLAHLAIYCGWPSVVSALEVYDQVYTARKVDTATLLAVAPRLPSRAGDAAHARAVSDDWGGVAPKFAQLTNDVVFGDLWQRSDLNLRDRSLVTIAALAAAGDDDQLPFYLRRGLESGLHRDQITEALTHLGFYAGWTKATKALTAVTRTLGR